MKQVPSRKKDKAFVKDNKFSKKKFVDTQKIKKNRGDKDESVEKPTSPDVKKKNSK